MSDVDGQSADKSADGRAGRPGSGLLARVRAHRVLLAVLALLVVLYGVAGFVVVPRVLRAQATAYVTQTLHRQLRIADIEFNPFTFTLDL